MTNNKAQEFLDTVTKAYGSGCVILPEMGGKFLDDVPETISTGSQAIDDATGIGGFPFGKIVEITGQEACLEENTVVHYLVRDNKTGKSKNCKGGTIKNLYRRIHGKKNPNADNDVFYTVPSFNENNCIFQNRIFDVVKTGNKTCYEVTTQGGLRIITTKDHKFFTPKGFISLEKLKVNSKVKVHINTTNKKKNHKKRQSYLEICVKYHPNHRKKIVTANNHRGEKTYSFLRYRVRNSHLAYEAFQNNLTYKQYRKLLNTAPSSVIDKMWTIPCGYEIHHLDQNRRNDSIENLQMIKSGEHQRQHALKNIDNLAFILTEDIIKNIKPVGNKETYDIKCFAPYNNYIANRFAVHNSGKTTLALSVISQAQAKGIPCGYIDTEQALNKVRAEELGVDFNKLFISQPDNGEQALNIMESMILSNHIKVIVVDSVAALTPKAEIEGEMNDANIGGLARMMGKAMRKNVAYINKFRVLVIFTNQIRNKIGGFGYGPQETTPGGNALKFYASMRLDMRRTGNNKKGEKLVSTNHKVVIKKNKFAPPFTQVQVKIGKNGFM